eukprot:TRINITY_DN2148_c0_g1_i1.p1 TRINITY_DN2148_c0_g1~~TRINITY_DN2148_c0_g1_i1.p1  ORF type:complete len:201 (-),score=46.50 TRINITY_DN2148_c0_g1_i1:215-817(-)
MVVVCVERWRCALRWCQGTLVYHYQVMELECAHTNGRDQKNKTKKQSAFWVLCWLTEKFSERGHSLFARDLKLLHVVLDTCVDLLALHCPALASHLVELGVEPTMYLSHWISTLFVYNSPRELVFRLWDVLFLESWTYIVRIALALITSVQGRVLQCSSLEEALVCLKAATASDPAALVRAAAAFPVASALDSISDRLPQ